MDVVLTGRRSDGARDVLVALACVAAVAVGVALLALTPGAERLPPGGRLVPVAIVVVGWGFTALGAVAVTRRPDNPTGALMIAFGASVLVSGLSLSDAPLPYLASGFADALALAVFVHLLLAFPAGRVDGGPARVVVAASYATALLASLVAALLGEPAGDPGCPDCPRNPVAVASAEELVEVVLGVRDAVSLALAAAAVVLVIRNARMASTARRRAFAPLALAGAVLLALVGVSVAAQALDLRAQKVAQLTFIAAFAGLPPAFLIGLLRSRFFRTATVERVIDRLAAGQGADGVEQALAAALSDPRLAVAFWLPERREYVGRDGRPFALPAGDTGLVTTEIAHHGRRLGALVHDASLAEDGDLMRAVAAAAGLALENDRLAVELRARLEALRASSARIVEAGDAERRRLGRDLHDGAQQRLVSLLLDLRLARERWEEEPDASRAFLDRALESAAAAVEELRDLASGIHPAVLSQRGLDAAIEGLATRSPVPVELDVELGADRLPAAVETAAYFLVAEGLTNVAKYARATYAHVAVRREDGAAVIEIADDGVGGADAGRGSGLRGLGDRVGALGGDIELDSPPARGTRLRARIPLTDAGR